MRIELKIRALYIDADNSNLIGPHPVNPMIHGDPGVDISTMIVWTSLRV